MVRETPGPTARHVFHTSGVQTLANVVTRAMSSGDKSRPVEDTALSAVALTTFAFFVGGKEAIFDTNTAQRGDVDAASYSYGRLPFIKHCLAGQRRRPPGGRAGHATRKRRRPDLMTLARTG